MVQLDVGLIGLEHIADAKRTDENADGIESTDEFAETFHPAVRKALAKIIHRATRNRTIRVFIAVFDAKRTFDKLCRHT